MITKLFRGFKRHIRDACKNFFRNITLSLSALAAINVTLIVVSFSILIGLNFELFSSDVEDNAEIIAFVQKDYVDSDIEYLTNEISSNPYVKEVVFSSKDEQLKITGEELGNFSSIASQFEGEENPLLHVYYIKVTDIEYIDDVKVFLEETNSFVMVSYGEEIVNQVISLFNAARIVVVIIIASLILVTVFIIYNTIRITLYSRSSEVEIMKLIGGSNYHIRAPFIYEGILIGIFGSIIPILVTTFGYKYLFENFNLRQSLEVNIDLINPDPIVYQLSGALLLCGVVVGCLGSILSVRSFLKK